MTTMTTTATPTVRLLAGYHDLGRAAGLGDHLARYGPLPRPAEAEHLIDAVEQSGLTGRDRAALPVARTLRAGRTVAVVVDAADHEPAGGKDRLLLTVAPHLVLDGAALAADVVGADEIVVRVHESCEPSGAVAERNHARLGRAPIRITGGGHLDGRPTLVLDAETCAHLALIARYGPEWFRACGTEEAPGTALFTISGAVVRLGVVEAPTGTSVGALLRSAGGPSEPVRAILTGGYGGTWLPPALLELPTTPSLLARAGVTLATGIVIALPARVSGLAESARVLAWLAGRCGPACGSGLPAIAEDFAALAAGASDVHPRLRDRLSACRDACPHSGEAARFALSALRVFGPDHHPGVLTECARSVAG
jgi:NADH:ubiquinone oxidoreductase subunit F (NADH-binding)